MHEYIEPEYLLNTINNAFEDASGDLKKFISKRSPDGEDYSPEEVSLINAFSYASQNLIRNVEHCIERIKISDNTSGFNIIAIRDIQNIAGDIKQAKIFLSRADQDWQEHTGEKETHPEICSTIRGYVETFDWTKLRGDFSRDNDYNTNPDLGIQGNAYDFINPEKREETIAALESALTIDPPSYG